MEAVEATRDVARAVAGGDYPRAMALRGGSFAELYGTYRTLALARPRTTSQARPRRRLAVLHVGDPAPGMNAAVRVAVRLALHHGMDVLGVANGFAGLAAGDVRELGWLSVDGWEAMGGAELGTSLAETGPEEQAAIARTLGALGIDALLVVGGGAAYRGALALARARSEYPQLAVPVVCLPAAIDNSLAGSELDVGADTALNTIVRALDNIKQSAVATKRCFVVEVMGRRCGYLALMSGLASGAEQVYLPEEGLTARRLLADLDRLKEGFRQGKRLGLVLRSADTNPHYTARFIRDLFEEESDGLFATQEVILGAVQEGGSPSPFDRILATRLAGHAVAVLDDQLRRGAADAVCVGLVEGAVRAQPLDRLLDGTGAGPNAALGQWWLDLRPVADLLAQSAPSVAGPA